jgi:hypothetical protein
VALLVSLVVALRNNIASRHTPYAPLGDATLEVTIQYPWTFWECLPKWCKPAGTKEVRLGSLSRRRLSFFSSACVVGVCN